MGSGLSKGSRKVHPITKSSKRNSRLTRNAGNNNGPNNETDKERLKRLEKLTANARNNINKLGSDWSYTIICGILNHNFMLELCSSISKNIKVTVLCSSKTFEYFNFSLMKSNLF